MGPRDPRLRLSLVIGSLQVLGQVALGFKVSIAQILVTIALCAAVEIAVELRRKGTLVWPASAMLTGNSVAFILRAGGTRHGDWWSLGGLQWFVLAALVGLFSKYLLRVGGRHVYNPSNLGLVLVLLLVGSPQVYPQYLWWGPMSPAVGVALAVIVAGGVWVLRPLGRWPMVASFLLAFGALIGLLAASGHCFDAVWHAGSVCGADYWQAISLSPEVLVFVLFMMSDPRTSPPARGTQAAFGAGVAVVAAALIALQPSEYGIKVALLAALAVACSIPAFAWTWRRVLEGAAWSPADLRSVPAVLAVIAVLATVPVMTMALSLNEQVLAIDRGEGGGAGGAAQ